MLAAGGPARAGGSVRLGLPGGPDERALTTDFPEKGKMVLQRTRPPLLETPFAVFDQLLGSDPKIDAGHAFYLGYEFAKAVTAFADQFAWLICTFHCICLEILKSRGLIGI